MTEIHIIAPFIAANGGDWHAIDLYLLMKNESNVQLWSPRIPNQAMAKYPIKEIKPYQGQVPLSGTLYVVGGQTEIGHWYEQAKFEKIVVIHNLFSPDALYRGLQRLTADGTRSVEIHYVSTMVRDIVGLPGEVKYSFPHPE